MTIQQQYDRALKGQETCRRAMREHPGNDHNLDHWAERLVFWKQEAKRLQRIADLDGHGLHDEDM